jgi:hypothetical protein
METPTTGAFLRQEPLISFSTANQGRRNKKDAHLDTVCLKFCTKDKNKMLAIFTLRIYPAFSSKSL